MKKPVPGTLLCPDWRRTILAQSLFCLLGLVVDNASAREFYFSPSSLEGASATDPHTDLTLFSNPLAQLPGRYPTTIVLNQKTVDNRPVDYLNGADGALVAQLTPTMLRQWGVKVDTFPALAALPAGQPLPEPLGHYIPQASAAYNFTTQKLALSFPQASLSATSGGYVDPSRWDAGLPVLFADYAVSGHEEHNANGANDNSQYLNLRSGINLGGWRLRNYAIWSQANDERHWQTIGSWLQHDIQRLRAQFIVGQNSTRGDVFDSVQYQGVNIASDDDMLPTSERGYAPLIRGIANSNAVVTVEQNGYTIYQANVAPGAFEIHDIYASSNSGDLLVSVKEADGTVHSFTQPFATVALMQRPQHWRFEGTAGRYRAQGNSDDHEPQFVQGSAIYGINNRLTTYGGATVADNYHALVAGGGLNLGRLGGLSLDITTASTEFAHRESQTGQSWRLLYSSSIDATNTRFTLASYRYSTRGYFSFVDANSAWNDSEQYQQNANKRERVQMSISQPFPGGNIYFNGYQQNYWDSDQKERSLSSGISLQHAGIGYNLAATWTDNTDSGTDRMLSFSVSIPLGRWMAGSRVSYSVSNNQNGDTRQNLGLSGVLLEDQSLSYSLQQSHSNQSPQNSNSVYSTWRSPWGNLSGGYYSASGGDRQISYGVSGAIVAHPRGVTLSQPLGEQFAIIDADGAAGLRFQNHRGIHTDWAGNAVIPSLTAYQENRIGLDTTLLPDDVDSKSTAVVVVPSRSAAVRAHFTARTGYRVIATLTLPDGQPVPFGALATSENAQTTGIVDDGGVLYLAGLAEKTTVTIRWGTDALQQCLATIDITDPSVNAPISGIKQLTALCAPEKHA